MEFNNQKLGLTINKFIFLFILLLQSSLANAQDFTIEDIRIEGLQRLTPGTIFNYLPVEIGDVFSDQTSTESIRELFKTGFFDDVGLERSGNILIIIVKERPSIGSIDIDGNKDIKTDDLLDGLKEVGFTVGRIFDQSQLDKLERELHRQYFSNGKYAVQINSAVESLANNRVAVSVNISEGVAAKIRQINIVGNFAISEQKLLDPFELSSTKLLSFFTKDDQYSRQKLSGDLELLRSAYLDNGYINFNIDSTQVTITPDKKDIYITINITEGEQYRISGIKLAGELIASEEELFEQIDIERGELFSRKKATDSSKRISDLLGGVGYAFANVNSIPDINDESNTVEITFFIDPGKQIYVRRINFLGNNKTRDEVLRREMRQQESGWISTPLVERGKVRLQRLGYFKEVNVETPAAPGSADQVDVNYTVEERPFGNFIAGLGFSQSQGLIISTSIAQDNFLGSGSRMAFAFNNSRFNRIFSVGYVNPYYTDDGISRGFNVAYRETKGRNANITAFDSRVFSGGVNFGIPISEFNSISTAITYENTELAQDGFFAAEVLDFINREGNQFDTIRLSAGFAYDTRNKAILPKSGSFHSILGEITVPSFGNSLEFYKISYRGQWLRPIYGDFIFSLKGNFGYGDGYLGSVELPFFENYYAGGPGSVRGYKENTLGPTDSAGRPIGGNIKIVGGAEIIFPIPFLKKFDQVRFSAFFEGGSVFCTGDRTRTTTGFDINGNLITVTGPVCSENNKFELGRLRYSAGIGGIWISPFGVIGVSVAKPINDKPGDNKQIFQFNFGTSF